MLASTRANHKMMIEGVKNPDQKLTSLTARDLRMVYEVPAADGKNRRLEALAGIDLEVGEGEFVSVIGPSGCGKSTLVEIIAGLRAPTSGELFIYKDRVTYPHPSIGIVFQEESIFPWRTVTENVEFGLEVEGVPKRERRERCQAIIDLVRLKGFEAAYPKQLSGGMKQRVAIARALAQDPKILLMDEPFGALDQQTRMHLGGELIRIWEKTQKTILFVTHDIHEAVYLSDQVLVMTHRPSKVKEIVRVDLPRPRGPETLSQTRFYELSAWLWELLRPESERDVI
jgi:NitT/TauT family transport system ATP-binding protein